MSEQWVRNGLKQFAVRKELKFFSFKNCKLASACLRRNTCRELRVGFISLRKLKKMEAVD